MQSITLTDAQNKKKNQIVDWFNSPSRLKNEPVFPLLGCSGSGKSSIIPYILEELNLNKDQVAYCAYTGMASLVLIKKGLSACTCHKLCYIPVEVEDKFTHKKKIIFKKKDELEGDIKLIVLDEGSMINEEMMNDILSFNIPVLMVGDYFQLQPVGGKMNMFMRMTQYGILDKPLRQALDNPIIWISDKLRHNELPKYGNYDNLVRIHRKSNFPEEVLYNTDQVIAGKNSTCDYLAKLIRIKFKKIKSKYPVDGDKLICIRNNWEKQIFENTLDVYLVNGLLGNVKNIRYKEQDKTFTCDFKPTFLENTYFNNLLSDKLTFDNVECKDENYVRDEYKDVAFSRIPLYSSATQINKFMFGDAITVYKMQGSQERHITYIDEVLNRNIYFNHFYTAVTRAEEELDIVM